MISRGWGSCRVFREDKLSYNQQAFLVNCLKKGLPRWLGGKKKNLPANAEDTGLNPWVGKIPWRRKWQPTPLFLPIEVHEQRCLVGYSPLGCKELDTAERPRMHACLKKSQIKNSKYSSTGGDFLSQSKIFTFIF